MIKFYGYPRANGRVGVRNHLLVAPSVFCAKKVAQQIAANIPGAVYLANPLGCSQVGEDLEQTARTLINLASHPNVGATLIVGLGCERFTPQEFYERVRKRGTPVKKIVIQETGDTLDTVRQGTELLYQLHLQMSEQVRKEVPLSSLALGLECGGTDASSGIAANPSIGVTSDLLIAEGGSSMFSETNEIIGSESILEKRCVSPQVAQKLLKTMDEMEKELAIETADPAFHHRQELISTGNFDGGVSTVVEKALGNILKAGKAPIKGVLKFAEIPKENGLFFMDTPSQDAESTTAMVAGGAQIILFTTGRGTPTGFPLAPVIKITGNAETYKKMKVNIDIDTSPVITKEKTLKQMGQEIFDMVLKVASGQQTKAEILGHDELLGISRVLASCRWQ
jgi:altronate dehydratase large subunit